MELLLAGYVVLNVPQSKTNAKLYIAAYNLLRVNNHQYFCDCENLPKITGVIMLYGKNYHIGRVSL